MSVEKVSRKGGEVVWRVRWRDHRGQNRSKVLGRKADADAFDGEIKRRRRTGELAAMDGGRETLDEYVSTVWSRAHASHLAPATRELYTYLYDSHIGPALGEIRLREITSEAIAQWQADLLEGGLGRSATKKAITLLGNILQRQLRVVGSPPTPSAWSARFGFPGAARSSRLPLRPLRRCGGCAISAMRR